MTTTDQDKDTLRRMGSEMAELRAKIEGLTAQNERLGYLFDATVAEMTAQNKLLVEVAKKKEKEVERLYILFCELMTNNPFPNDPVKFGKMQNQLTELYVVMRQLVYIKLSPEYIIEYTPNGDMFYRILKLDDTNRNPVCDIFRSIKQDNTKIKSEDDYLGILKRLD